MAMNRSFSRKFKYKIEQYKIQSKKKEILWRVLKGMKES